MADPLKRYAFGIFLLFGVLTIVWLISWFAMAGAAQTYIMAAVACIVMSVYGYGKFHLLLGFKEQLDVMSEKNTEFQKENLSLSREVGKLERAEKKMRALTGEFKESNQRLQSTIESFHKLDETLKNLGEQNLDGLKELKQKSDAVMQNIQEGLIRQEKHILHKVFDYLEYNDREAGFTKEEFEAFWKEMPAAYNERWRQTGKTFEDVAGDDGIIDQEDFTRMANEFARDEGIARARGRDQE